MDVYEIALGPQFDAVKTNIATISNMVDKCMGYTKEEVKVKPSEICNYRNK